MFLRSILFLWYVFATLSSPVLSIGIRWRLKEHKELPSRVSERFGISTQKRPSGTLLWFHASSVGEMNAILPVCRVIREKYAQHTILLTTSTVSAFKVLKTLKLDVIHQFIPWDVPLWCIRFLSYWRPTCAIFIESELWPVMLTQCRKKHIPLTLLNGRLSQKTFRRWSYVRSLFAYLINNFSTIQTCDEENKYRFQQLGYHGPIKVRNLKAIPPKLSSTTEKKALKLKEKLSDRQIFLAASVHEQEIPLIIEATQMCRAKLPSLLTIIVPRHPGEPAKSHFSHRSDALLWHQPTLPTHQTLFWYIDDMGLMDLMISVSTCVFMGNSLKCDPGGGHNPFEAAFLGKPVASGPYIWNFNDLYQSLSGTITWVHDVRRLAHWIVTMLSNEQRRHAAAQKLYERSCQLEISPDELAGDLIRGQACS